MLNDLRDLKVLDNGIAFTGRRLLEFNDRRLDMLNVKYVVVPNSSPEFAHLKSAVRFSLAYNDGYTAAFDPRRIQLGARFTF